MGGQMGGPQIYSKQGFLLYPPPTDDNDNSKTTNKQTNKQTEKASRVHYFIIVVQVSDSN